MWMGRMNAIDADSIQWTPYGALSSPANTAP